MIPIEDYPNINENCGNFPDGHPLKIALSADNEALLNFLEGVLSRLRGIKGLKSKIKEIKKDRGNFNSYVSELKVAAFLKDRVDDLEILSSRREVQI